MPRGALVSRNAEEPLAGLEAGLREHPAPDDLPQTAAEWVDELLQAGALGWLPAPATA